MDRARRRRSPTAGGLDDVEAVVGRRPAARHGLPRRGRAPSSAPRCCGTTPARPARPTELIAELGRPAGVGRRGRARSRRVVHRHQAALARATTSRRRRAVPRAGLPPPRLADLAAARHAATSPTWSPTAATPAARATGPRRRATTATTCSSSRSATTRVAAAGPRPGRAAAGTPTGGAVSGPGTGDNAASALGLWRRSRRRRRLDRHVGRRLRGLRGPGGRPAPASSPASPTPPAATCRWSAPSTPPGCSTPPPAARRRPRGLSDLALAAPSGRRRARCWCPTSRASARPTARHATASLHGLTLDTWTPATGRPRRRRGAALRARRRRRRARRRRARRSRRVLLVGGGAASRAVREIAPAVLGRPVHVPAAGGVRRPRRRPPGRLGPVRRLPSRRRGHSRTPRCTRAPPRPPCAGATRRPATTCSTPSEPTSSGSVAPGVGPAATGCR